uniref:Uncharacterized protein n=1 Tax=Siphoviridae sp. ctREU2 TaxID=2826333 RepID=A0A8S5NJT3_9CAUD|nr:MAG TPA: hypothetical protein [Siphoviridae sp. ctREU2]
MDKFQDNEEKGRRIFESLLKQSRTAKNWNPTINKYDFVDGFFELGDKKIVVEIKTRDIKYADYPSHLIQIDKYMNLTKAKIDNCCSTGIYVNIFGNDLIYLYDLKYINASNCKLTSRYVNSTTAIDTGKRWKQFYEIPVRYAQVFEKDVDRWKQINK